MLDFLVKETLNMFSYEFKSLMHEHNMIPQQVIINNLFVLSVNMKFTSNIVNLGGNTQLLPMGQISSPCSTPG